MNPEARGASVFALSQGGASTARRAGWPTARTPPTWSAAQPPAKDETVLRTLLDMSTTAQIKDSLKLGGEVLGQIGKVGKLHKGQRRAGELRGAEGARHPVDPGRVGVHLESEEENKLRDPAYRAQLVEALVTGIQRYFARNPPLARSRRL
jgi:N-acetylmuramoyl-L-alanine amidase